MTRLRARIEPSTMALSAIVVGTILVGIFAYVVIANIRTDARIANNTRLDLQTMLVLVIDEETGVRGYAATGSTLFLQPYREANRRFPSTLAILNGAAQNPNLTSIQDDLEGLRRSHSLWEADVAMPVVKGTSSADSHRRLRNGKLPMDRIRAHVGQARIEVEAVANRLSLEVQQAIIVSILAIVLMTIALGIVAVRFEHARLREEQRLREQVDERNAALERSNQSLREFAYVASHDLQEPLRTIASFTELLQKRYGGRLDADADEFIGFVVDGAKRMQQLIDDVLEYSRVSTHGKPLVPVDLDAVARRAVANLRASIEEHHAEVTVGPLPHVMGDEIQLGQLLQNLIGNALKYNRSARPRVTVSASRDRAGVPRADLPHLLAPAHARRVRRDGHRLGHLQADRRPARRTNDRRLRRRPGRFICVHLGGHSGGGMVESDDMIQVLLIEDSPSDARLMQEAFRDGKIVNTLTVVTDGFAALEYLHRRGKYAKAARPDLILLDLNLPKMDGREVLRRIKIDDDLKTIPVVVLTTSEADQDVIKAYEYHANCYIRKPVDLARFLEIISMIEDFWLTVVKLPSDVEH